MSITDCKSNPGLITLPRHASRDRSASAIRDALAETGRSMTSGRRVVWALLFTLISVSNGSSSSAEDWPHWRGLRHDGVSSETNWTTDWPEDGPRKLWTAAVGTGFSAVAILDGRLFTMGNRDHRDIVWCLDAETGKELWKHGYECPLDDNLFDGGPTATPSAVGLHVFTISRRGDVFCLEQSTGTVVWSRQLGEEESMPIPAWGFAGSPLVTDKLVIFNVGSAGMALDRTTGRTVWKSNTEEAGYTTPVPFPFEDQQFVAIASGREVTAVSVSSGQPLWTFRWLTRYGVNASDPIIMDGHRMFLSSGYSKGCALVDFGKNRAEQIWKSRSLRNQISCSVLIDGAIYGFDGDTGGATSLRCIDPETGDIHWSQDGLGAGSLTAANGQLIVLSENGELLVAPANQQAFEPVVRSRVIDGRCWTVPVLSNHRIHCRNAAGTIVCLDVERRPPNN